jgi:hypothetical protein
MRHAFAHEADLSLGPGTHEGAPGGAITVALCGHWEHEPPCPLAPHHTSVERMDGGVHLRALFVVEPEHEGEVRRRLEEAPEWQTHRSG